MSDTDLLHEMAPLAALGALDAADAERFARHLAECPDCRREMDAFAAVVGEMGLASPATPAPELRARVLAALSAPASRPAGQGWLAKAAAVAALALGVGLVATQRQCAVTRERAERLEAQLEELRERSRTEEARRADLERRLGEQLAVQELLVDPQSRTAVLAGLPAAPRASARVVWNVARRRAVLLASGLEPAPAGKVYEVWVIAEAAPVPSGLFQVDEQGRAAHTLPWVEQTARARTFAVTLEPAGGTPAPTGPMVLAGPAS